MASTCNRPYSNKLGDHKIKLIWLALYYGLAIHLPGSYSFMGKLFRAEAIRYALCRRIFLKCGKNVNIEHGCNFGSGLEIEIVDNSGMGIDCTLPSNVKIGDNVMMGPKCFFLAFNHAYKDKSKSIQSQGYTDKKIIRIGNDVWIGREVLFTPGRIVKDGTVIAARTVVCKDFASYSVIGGNPARLIATRE